MTLAIIAGLAAYAVRLRWELRRSRRMQLELAWRIYLAFEVLANRAERKSK